jgi:hypothetical protein
MRTNVVLEDELIGEAFKYANGIKTKKDLITTALAEFIQHHRRWDLRELRGKIQFAPSYNYKALRRGTAK